MMRVLCAASVILAASACTGRDAGPDLEARTLVTGETNPYHAALSPDGSRLAWAMPVKGRSAIHVSDRNGANPVRLTSGVWDRNPVWSPDGKWIAYHGEAPNYDVFVVSSEGGASRQLTSGPADDVPAGWLPDGSGIVFYRYGDGDIQTLVVPLDSGPVRPIVPRAGGNQFVAVSPDGTKAAWDLHRGGETTIWVQDLAGGTPRQLTTEGLEGALTAHMWSPDSRSVLYLSRRTGTWDIWIADVTTGDLHQLTSDVRNDFQPRWSPDGRWVVFRSDRGGQNDVWIIPAAGGKARRVTNDLAVEDRPQWTADGRAIVFERNELSSSLGLMAVDGSTDRTLVSYDGYAITGAELSPDGQTVLLTSTRSGNPDIWSVPVAGGEPTPFVTSPVQDTAAQYSPDGTTVAFISDRAGSRDLWVMPAAGGEARQLLDWPSSEGEPRWSPDGSMIAFTSDRDATQLEIWVIPSAGGEPTRLTTNGTFGFAPHWAPDGSAIFYRGSASEGGQGIYRVSPSGGAPVALGSTPGAGIGTMSLSPDGAQVAYTLYAGGWGYLEVVPATGGTPRRLTTDSVETYVVGVTWSPEGSVIAMSDYDYPHDTYDIKLVSWPDGALKTLTETPEDFEFVQDWSRDGKQLLYIRFQYKGQIMEAPVAGLMEGAKETASR